MYRNRTRMNRSRFDSGDRDFEKFKKKFEKMLDGLLDATDDEFRENRGDLEGLVAELKFKDSEIEAKLAYLDSDDEVYYDYISLDGKFRDDLYEVATDLKRKLLAILRKNRSAVSLSYEDDGIYDLAEKEVREAYRTLFYKTLML